ncbi:MAG TPA: class GN sortase, partial [Kiloniellaceae bacterium]|nr:class GN sortase [Kiloniellaceae bacterium]
MASALSLNRALTVLLWGLAALSLALGLWQLGGAAAIQGKAWLAQRLLDRAWSETLAGGPPVKPWPWADTWPVARLRVPVADVDLYVLAGASGRSLAFGPAEVEGTAGLGHRILGGHRDTHFAFLRDLPDGTRVELQDAGGRWQAYRVSGRQVVDVRHPVMAVAAEAAELLTLVTCWPFDTLEPGGPLRYAVTAEAIPSDRPLGGAAFPSTTAGGDNLGEGIP